MTEIEQLRADLATLKETSKIYLDAYGYFPAHHDLLIKLTKEKIADLEAQQAPPDLDWDEVQRAVRLHLQSGGHNVKAVAQYARHLEAELAKRAVSQVADAIVKEMDDYKQRETLAELTTITNAIPPACGLARELVERRIEDVKKEMQGKQQKGDAGKTTDKLDPRRVLATARDILKHYSQFISAEDGWETKNIQQAINTINFMAGTEAEPLKWEKQPHQSELEAKNES